MLPTSVLQFGHSYWSFFFLFFGGVILSGRLGLYYPIPGSHISLQLRVGLSYCYAFVFISAIRLPLSLSHVYRYMCP